jgi:hypothetical protein
LNEKKKRGGIGHEDFDKPYEDTLTKKGGSFMIIGKVYKALILGDKELEVIEKVPVHLGPHDVGSSADVMFVCVEDHSTRLEHGSRHRHHHREAYQGWV